MQPLHAFLSLVHCESTSTHYQIKTGSYVVCFLTMLFRIKTFKSENDQKYTFITIFVFSLILQCVYNIMLTHCFNRCLDLHRLFSNQKVFTFNLVKNVGLYFFTGQRLRENRPLSAPSVPWTATSCLLVWAYWIQWWWTKPFLPLIIYNRGPLINIIKISYFWSPSKLNCMVLTLLWTINLCMFFFYLIIFNQNVKTRTSSDTTNFSLVKYSGQLSYLVCLNSDLFLQSTAGSH